MLDPPHIPESCRKPRSRRPHSPHLHGTTSEPLINPTSAETHSKIITNSIEAPVIQVESLSLIKNRFSRENWEVGSNIIDRIDTHSHAGTSNFSFKKSKFPVIVKCKGSSWLHPGNIVWARNENQEWWPAQVMDGRGLLQSTGIYSIGRNLVQFFGNHKYAWVDPVRDLSEFHAFYKVRSKNPLKAFQDALSEALQKHLHTTPEPSFESTPSTSTVNDEFTDQGRGKRKRKLKIHFDELTFTDKPVKRIRRIRIMRYLGLIAPAGSPFCNPRVRSTI